MLASSENPSATVAIIEGNPITELPKDLYIPPDALRLFLESFEGPMDLLLYLIKKQNLDIMNIPVAQVTQQYVTYVDLMQEINLELAAEYLVMAAFLAEIKSRLLLPRMPSLEAEEADPRAELVRRLQEYAQFKKAAEQLDALPRIERDILVATIEIPVSDFALVHPKVELPELLNALANLLKRVKLQAPHRIQLETLSIRERMIAILDRLKPDSYLEFSQLFCLDEGRLGIAVTFIATLELIRQSLIDFVQDKSYAPIYLRVA